MLDADIYDYIIMVTVVAGILLFIGLAAYASWYDGNSVYVNYTGVVTDKYEDSGTNVVPVSTGRTVSVVPVSYHYYYVVVDNHTFKVSSKFYGDCGVGDIVNLTRNCNNSEVSLNMGG